MLAPGDHANDTARRPGQNAVFAAKPPRLDQPTIALHEKNLVAFEVRLTELLLKLPDVLLQNGRQVCVCDGRIAAAD